jgi:spermidine synthase
MSESDAEKPDAKEPVATLASGLHAVVRSDRFNPGSFELIVDGTPQSHVDLDDPGHLFYEYIQRMGHVIDLLAGPGEAITAVHLGAGAMTIPRYVEHTRPGSRQQVIELEPALVELVRESLPLPRGASIRVRYGDAREALGRLPTGLLGTADLVVVDIFGGARTPAHVTSLEFYSEIAPLLTPTGIVLVNVADGPPLSFARSQAATLFHAFGHVAVLADTQILKGRRFGNVVFAASQAELPLEWMPRILAGGPHPAKVVEGRELNDWIAGAAIRTDATATPSPPPSRMFVQLRGD